MNLNARYTDGQTSEVRLVSLNPTPRALMLYLAGDLDPFDVWHYEDMRVTQDWSDLMGGVIGHKTKSGAALSFEDKTVFQHLQAKLSSKDKATYRIPVTVLSLVFFFLASSLMIGIGLPMYGQLAGEFIGLVPDSVERKIGDMQIEIISEEWLACSDPAAEKALQKITDHLVANSNMPKRDVKLHLFKTPVSNAFALPGDNMALLTGFLAEADNENELAGVLAHELGHIDNHDALRITLQTQGYSLITSLMTGSGSAYSGVGQIATLAHTLHYSREREQAADDYAVRILRRAGYSSQGLASFLGKMMGGKDSVVIEAIEKNLSFLSTHPATGDRIRKLEDEKKSYKGILTKLELRAIKNACRQNDPTADAEINL